VKDIPGAADRIICVRTDVTVRADVKALEAAAAAALGPVDVLINNGAAIDSPIALFPPSLPPASLIPCSYPLYDTGAI
jgi:NAD(P)-dependent dehydrogenase (short-subunit alcohol dehydrogenase family)